MNNLQIHDNFLSPLQLNSVKEYSIIAPYLYGEYDKTKDLVPKDMNLYRMYINCFAPSERPYFHRDGDTGITFLYYVNGTDDLNEGGETQIVEDGLIKGVLPISNRLVQFNANVLHRATTYRNSHRFTLAVKYS